MPSTDKPSAGNHRNSATSKTASQPSITGRKLIPKVFPLFCPSSYAPSLFL
ncbi:hypothetical protein [Parachlamydia sp. AcF125]|uniref:hypothetical protein n=1 Tax=Parachlamydia sp. AcF125 TaxID=2795736 RepID=UPI001BC9A965|nr:hypothetical protein [Parachlamydia sp. AcF125]MBS4168662.1 hypothetical protein [Parachlamydia sp. AcF125]